MLLASGVSVWAQTPIRVEVTGQAATHHASGASIPVTINSAITGTVQVKIYDVNSLDVNGGVPSNSIGPVTISGTVGTSGAPLLEVLIADGDTGFPITPTELMTVGAIDFGSLSFSSTALRDIARVAVAVGGDITGNIDAGAIRRIQALGRIVSGPTYTGGKITGNITATSPDFSTVAGGFGFSSFRAMGVVWAGDEISGTITATSNDATFPGGLTWLLVGNENNPSIDGLLGDVRIDYGTIEKVHTAGPIGSVSLTPKIWAGRSIYEVRVLDASELGGSSPEAVGSAAIKSDIRGGVALTDPISSPPDDGAIGLIETLGDLEGSVTIPNLFPVARSSTGQAGILVGGAISAPISVEYMVYQCDIIAASIEASITIGVQLRGAIVATGAEGTIDSVEIGYNDSEEGDGYAATWGGRVFTGVSCRPVDPDFALPADEYTHEDWTAVVNHCVEGTSDTSFNNGSTDAVIRAHSIGTVRIVEMAWTSLAAESLKIALPRIESPTIEELEIGVFQGGSIWSGNLEFEAGTFANNPENDYASIGSSLIGSMGYASDLWTDGATRVQIDGDMLGQIHVPTLTETIWIGGRLGLWCHTPGCLCEPLTCSSFLQSTLEEESPRDTVWEFADEDEYARGEIVIRDVGGLQGQIIINGNNDGGTWDGAVIVGAGEGPERGRRAKTTLSLDLKRINPIKRRTMHSFPARSAVGPSGLFPLAFTSWPALRRMLRSAATWGLCTRTSMMRRCPSSRSPTARWRPPTSSSTCSSTTDARGTRSRRCSRRCFIPAGTRGPSA